MMIRTTTLSLITALAMTVTLAAQDITLTLAPGHEVVLDGTSNVRDWGAQVETIDGELTLKGFEGDTFENFEASHLKSLRLNMLVESMDSGTRGLTRNMHSYLKRDDHPEITFELQRVTGVEASGNQAVITAEGTVTAAGVSNLVTMEVHAERGENGSFIFFGNQDLKMTDYNITPPTALLGTVRAVDEMNLIYTVEFTR